MREIPRIISVDDHVIEPPDLWQRWLPSKFRDRGPRVVHDHHSIEWIQGIQTIRRGGDGPKTDFWIYEDLDDLAETSRVWLNFGQPAVTDLGIVLWANRSPSLYPANSGVPITKAATVTLPAAATSGLVIVREET